MIARSGPLVAGLPIFLALLAWPSPARSDPVAMSAEQPVEIVARAEKGANGAGAATGKVQLTAPQKAEIDKIARMILNGESESKVRREWLAYWKKYGEQIHAKSRTYGFKEKYDSKTEGAGSLANEPSLEALRGNFGKDYWDSVAETDQKILEAQRKQVAKMMEMIEKMTEELVSRID